MEGEVISKIWLNSKGTFGEAMQAVRADIMRSLATRMELHWDSLIGEELREGTSPKSTPQDAFYRFAGVLDVNSVHEPPRRVLIALPDSNVCVSDYLFSGEASADSKISMQALFDVKADDHWEVLDLEGPAGEASTKFTLLDRICRNFNEIYLRYSLIFSMIEANFAMLLVLHANLRIL